MIDAAHRRHTIEPREISQESNTQVRITWADDRVCNYNAAALRRVCPCAQCVSETTGQRLVSEEHIGPDVAIEAARTVGNYALHFDFNDGHTTGIYSFEYLRRICPCEECA